jgi:hypothetical protein
MNVLMAGWNRKTVAHPAVIYSASRLYVISFFPHVATYRHFPLFVSLSSRSSSFYLFVFVLVNSFHPSQHDIRRYIKAWGGFFFRLVIVCPVETFQSIPKKTDPPNGLVASSAL